eukprot:gene21853-28883_t
MVPSWVMYFDASIGLWSHLERIDPVGEYEEKSFVWVVLAVQQAQARFVFLDKVGSGAYGEVWRCFDTETRRLVAIKMFKNNRKCPFLLPGPGVHCSVSYSAQVVDWIRGLCVRGLRIAGRGLGSRPRPAEAARDGFAQVKDMINKLARKGMPPSAIGVLLRDQHAIPGVTAITGSKILRILKGSGLAPEIPEDLYSLIKKAVSMRKHLERFRRDRDAKFRLILIESRIHRLARYYVKTTRQVPPTFKYESATASVSLIQDMKGPTEAGKLLAKIALESWTNRSLQHDNCLA